ncbi:hypothetical protein Tco_0959701 [Tanacetum coccineum]
MEDGIFFNQFKYIKEMLKKFGLEDSKPTKTPMSTKIKLIKDDEADSVECTKYRERGDGVASIKRRHHDLQSDDVSTLVTPSEHGRPKGTL